MKVCVVICLFIKCKCWSTKIMVKDRVYDEDLSASLETVTCLHFNSDTRRRHDLWYVYLTVNVWYHYVMLVSCACCQPIVTTRTSGTQIPVMIERLCKRGEYICGRSEQVKRSIYAWVLATEQQTIRRSERHAALLTVDCSLLLRNKDKRTNPWTSSTLSHTHSPGCKTSIFCQWQLIPYHAPVQHTQLSNRIQH